jgi:hypothetical protein
MFNFLQVVIAAETGGALGGMVRQLSSSSSENIYIRRGRTRICVDTVNLIDQHQFSIHFSAT